MCGSLPLPLRGEGGGSMIKEPPPDPRPPAERRHEARAIGLGATAAAFWALLAVRWFDAGAPWRPAWLAAIPPPALAFPTPVARLLWLHARWPILRGERPRQPLCGLPPRVRAPLQPEQRRELRGGPGSRHLGPVAHRALGQRRPRGRDRRTPHPGPRRRSAARPRLLVPHPGRHPPGRGGH